jgi:two-component system response regulator NreC
MTTKFLIVEAHGVLRRALRGWLETKFPGCHIVEATNEEEAVATVQAVSPHVVIMDISLPEMNGLDCMTQIKAVEPAIQVLVLTTFEDEIYHAVATANGADAYVPKARMLTNLQPALAALLARPQNSQSEPLHLNN